MSDPNRDNDPKRSIVPEEEDRATPPGQADGSEDTGEYGEPIDTLGPDPREPEKPDMPKPM